MHSATVSAILLVLQCSELCLSIRVPVAWDNGDNSEVQEESKDKEFSAESSIPQNGQNIQKPIPTEYFEYTAKKPQFAVDIAKFHGVQSPENHYKSYPIRPYTGKDKPVLGIHHMLDEDKKVYQPYQEFVKKSEKLKNHVSPVSSNYEVFHPYKAEEPALQELYKDPTLTKIRNDVYSTKNRLQNYEQQAGEPNINKDEYLENPKQTDDRFIPQRNVPAKFEIHRPQRRPIYYKPLPKFNNRDQILNQKLRHPWNQNFVKVRPVHYHPVKMHLQQLRQNHALKYDDERNEYPQLPSPANIEEPQDGYDIYEKGKEKFVQLRNNVDESINQAVRENRPVIHQKLEFQNEEPETDVEDEFVPIKNYAQVRKTEIVKHLPREAAFEDAENYDEIKNAPRLREAVKSTKAQTVYSEEGYEDTAYDHAGEQKHASDHENHGGYLKEKEISEGKFKTPSESANYEDGGGAAYGDKVVHGEKWKNDNKDNQEVTDTEDYSENEQEKYVEAETYQDDSEPNRNKREYNNAENSTNDSDVDHITTNETDTQHDIDKRAAEFEVPQINFDNTLLTEADILKISKIKIEPKKDDIKEKYPYYFNNVKSISKHSPLRYAENFKFIPKKSKGGTEFYDSRSNLECPEVDDNIDPIPEKLKTNENPNSEENDEEDNQDNENSKGENNFEKIRKQPRLNGLGDKIDCFKAKYFGENPLDSPFFKEDLILNPEPVTPPNSKIYKLKKVNEKLNATLASQQNVDIPESQSEQSQTNIFVLLDKLRSDQNKLQDSPIKTNKELTLTLPKYPANTSLTNDTQLIQSNLYADIMDNINNTKQIPILTNMSEKTADGINLLNHNSKIIQDNGPNNITYDSFYNKEDITKKPSILRKKRSVPFIYEPYKIIRDSQVQDSKKTTTSSNISPLIKQLQSSRVVDRVTKLNQDKEISDKYVKRNVGSRAYKDIGRKERERNTEIVSEDPSFVDVNVDKRRGEPRYELKPANHKLDYTPVDSKKSMTVEDYKSRTSNKNLQNSQNNEESTETSSRHPSRDRRNSRQRRPTPTPNFDVSKFIPLTTEIQNTAASNDVKQSITVTSSDRKLETKLMPAKDSDSDDEDYEEYDEDDEEDEEEETITTTTTTTQKPTFRRRMRIATTTQKPEKIKKIEPEVPKLRLVTRFRDFSLDPTEKSELKERTERPLTTQTPHIEQHEVDTPKYREKKKKSTSRTLVTDTKKYGNDDDDDDDDMRKDEIDAMIGGQQDMEDYVPLYEKEEKNDKHNKNHSYKPSEEDDDEFDDDNDDDDDSDEDDDDNDDDEDEEDEEEELKLEVTTPEPTKRTLARTTDAPAPTTEVRNAKIEIKPVISRKKIEIHQELPVNKSSPHTTQFKQDIKEVEIIREIPSAPKKKPAKNVEALELYKDDELAKNINKLSDVEVFNDNLDLENGPKHGGNYRRATMEELKELEAETKAKSVEPKHGGHLKIPKEDAETSQSENKKHIELDEYTPKRLHGGNLRSLTDLQRAGYRGRNSKIIELTTERTPKALHGGNLRGSHHNRGRSNNRSEKLRDFNEDRNNDDNNSRSNSRGTNSYDTSKNERPMHGGNYRSAKLVQADEKQSKIEEGDDIQVKLTAPNARKSSAVLLNSFAQAIPILTTTPGYILDPSKRMYYYVD